MDPHTGGGDTPTPAAEGAEPLSRPPHLTPYVDAVPGADAQFVEIGRRYWDWLGFDRDPAAHGGLAPSARWVEPPGKIAADAGEHVSRLYIVAAAGVKATLPQVRCPTCRAPLVLRSRQALDVLARGGDPRGQCARCNDTLQRALAKLTDPVLAAKRQARKEREQAAELAAAAASEARHAQNEARRVFQSACRQELHIAHPLNVVGPDAAADFDALDARLRTELAALTML